MRAIFFFIVSFLFQALAFAQTGNLVGIVTSEKKTLPGVNVFVLDQGIGGATDEDGSYRIKNIKEGNHKVRFSSVGFQTKFIDVIIFANKTLELNVDLSAEAIEVGLVEVIDKGIESEKRSQVSLLDVEPSSVRILPGAVTDVFRTLQTLPGVLSPNDFSSQLIVRGSGPDQNLIIMDDVEIFNPYRLYGVVSMFNPETVTDINLITGGFPAKYGDRLSAVLDISNRQGNLSKSLTGNLNASIVSANLVLEGKNPFSLPGSWLLTSRRTYYDLIIEPFVKSAGLVEENVTFPNFFDIQTKWVFGPFEGHKFFLNGILSRDAVNVVTGEERVTPDSVSVVNDTNNNLVSLAWHYAPNNSFLNKLVLSWYTNDGASDLDSEILDPSLNREAFENASADTLSAYLLNFGVTSDFGFEKYAVDDKMTIIWNNANVLEAGLGMDFMKTKLTFDFNIDPSLQEVLVSNPFIRTAFVDLNDTKEYNRYRAYIQNRFVLSEKLSVTPGLRYDFYNIINKGYVAPRLSAAYKLDDLTTLKTNWGIYYQSIGYEKLRDRQILFDLSDQYTLSLRSEKAVHYVLGLERWITSEWMARIETYYKDFDNLIEPKRVRGVSYFTERVPGTDPKKNEGWTRPVPVYGDSLTTIPVNSSYGEAFGIEFFLEKRNIAGNSKIDGWFSYSFSKAARYESGIEIPFQFDQRHTLNLVLNYTINNWLDIGVRFQYGSGFPFTEPIGVKPRIILEDNDADGITETPVIATRKVGGSEEVIFDVAYGDLSNTFSSKKPAYHRLDLRLTAKADYWDLDWSFYLDIINVYNRSNVLNYDYAVSRELRLERITTSMFPILPTFGFIVNF